MNQRLLDFVAAITRMAGRAGLSQSAALEEATRHMTALVAQDDWLPPAMAASDPQRYQQHLLYGDPLDRFSLVSFVWGPGQATPVHDHTVWGVIGMLRGAEQEVPYEQTAEGTLRPSGPARVLRPGEVARVAPGLGDTHAVSNALADQVSISIHLYGGNIGRIRRHVYDTRTGQVKPFVSGYSNTFVPNLWAAQP
jgi:predicted metal-dependent enzyme (double-stranded beta helix superfamily)